MRIARSMEYFTSDAVILSPLANFRPSRRVQDHQGLHGLAQDVPGADVVRVGGVERRRSLLRRLELVRGADDYRAAAGTPAAGTATRGEHRCEQADDSRQHQSLAVHAGVSPELFESVYLTYMGW
jgi:hypothetical protein